MAELKQVQHRGHGDSRRRFSAASPLWRNQSRSKGALRRSIKYVFHGLTTGAELKLAKAEFDNQIEAAKEALAKVSVTVTDFKVADTVFAEAKDYTRDQWEAALDKAEERAEPDAWPLILVDDFA